MFQKIKIFILCFFCSAAGFSQDLQKDLEAVISSLDSTQSVSIKTTVAVYDQKGGKKRYSAEASLQRNKHCVLSILDDVENFENNDYSVSVDHEEKAIMIARKSKCKEKVDMSKADLKKIQKLLSEESSGEKQQTAKQIRMVSEKEGIRKYEVVNLKDIQSMNISLNMHTLAITEIAYEYAESSEYKGQYVLIQYTEFKKGTDLSGTLNQGKYFSLKNGKYVLNAAYKTYELFTQP